MISSSSNSSSSSMFSIFIIIISSSSSSNACERTFTSTTASPRTPSGAQLRRKLGTHQAGAESVARSPRVALPYIYIYMYI